MLSTKATLSKANITGMKYCLLTAVKDKGMFPETNLAILMQDGAKPHVTNLTLTQIEKNFRNC